MISWIDPERNQFSWFGPNYNSKSRIDYWLISNNLIQHDYNCNISAAPLTDQSVIYFQLKPKSKFYSNKYWKFNSSLLKNEEYCQQIRDLINDIKSNEELNNPTKKMGIPKM